MIPGVNSTGSSWTGTGTGTGTGGGGGALESEYIAGGDCCTKPSCICGREEENTGD